MIGAGEIQPRSPFYIPQTSSGQYPLSNAARTWTKLWLILQALGWRPGTPSPSSPPVRVSFHSGRGSFITDLISNPRFFELVMGWPIGWTAPGAPVTGFAAWLRRSRIALSQLTSPAICGGPGVAHEA
ncbi:MAG: hypothetical protein NBV68_07565 [Erythrobacter sp.]|uniref:hypothetical protein n=1 Tax=Erythrobacter sp. TaxID=1042 RepID=UPI0025E37D5E|nr:hypothetical protein [Erythrobacter sp.]MCL9999223.1 hypothetical protein [Erythrobacter sp.]